MLQLLNLDILQIQQQIIQKCYQTLNLLNINYIQQKKEHVNINLLLLQDTVYQKYLLVKLQGYDIKIFDRFAKEAHLTQLKKIIYLILLEVEVKLVLVINLNKLHMDMFQKMQN
ncbi:unnamed protein product [Paramecium sonneborni]|uniref:Uncharacterized protein n=1 Tax=Paramecium sonneborni TaxID=65129 RepID=A0A8S1QVL2_9CILI|nr:unnamed protein product [Paramecium sonneborni]